MGKIKKHQPDDFKHSIQYTLFMNQKDFLSTQNTIFTAFIATVEKNITYALGEHDPGSAQNWRKSTSAALFGDRKIWHQYNFSPGQFGTTVY